MNGGVGADGTFVGDDVGDEVGVGILVGVAVRVGTMAVNGMAVSVGTGEAVAPGAA